MTKMFLCLAMMCNLGTVSALATTTDEQLKAEGKDKLYAVGQTKTVAGAQSFDTEALIAELFVTHVQDGNYSAGLKTLDQALDFDLSTVETPTEAMTHTQCGVSAHQTNMTGVLRIILLAIRQIQIIQPSFSITSAEKVLKADSFAITSGEKVLKAQEAQLPADDERLVETLGVLADACFRAKKYKEADGYYSRAYKITTRCHAESTFTVGQCGHNFLANLKEVGRSEEADRLSKLNGDPHLVNTLLPPEFQAFFPEFLNHPRPPQL